MRVMTLTPLTARLPLSLSHISCERVLAPRETHIVQCGGLYVVNEPREWYIFTGQNGCIKTHVTLTNGAGIGLNLTWTIRADLRISDHTVIVIAMCNMRTALNIC